MEHCSGIVHGIHIRSLVEKLNDPTQCFLTLREIHPEEMFPYYIQVVESLHLKLASSHKRGKPHAVTGIEL